MSTGNDEFTEHVKREAVTRWKWKNPILAGVLAFLLGPLGLLYYSWKKALLGLVIVFVAAEIMRYNGWWPAPIWVRLLAMAAFGIYAYVDTRWMNAAIEFYKHGLPGTGMQRPPGI